MVALCHSVIARNGEAYKQLGCEAVAVKVFETASHYVDTIFGCGVGGLIHAAVGSFGGCGGLLNRLGLAA
ncbi:hypothetical protein MLAC_06030 [Mycobacterium lacus]|uniref:Uncharacterized protein n=1 Tax=Mycobacterium lacus TaxID=169765 RepID=A0A7I7NG18_9MYCO|nr:hypothetical protein MLAC_06030 [Mycobacterium lacus]